MKGRSGGTERASAKRVRDEAGRYKGNGVEKGAPDGAVPEEAVEGRGSAVQVATGPALRPGQCRRYMKQRLAAEFPSIVQGFVEGAKAGSCAHVKLVTELLGEPPATRSRRKGSAAQLLEELGAQYAGRAD